MSKEAFIAAHEEAVEEYLEAHPNATWEQAYDATADYAYDRMRDRYADMADHARLNEELRAEAIQELRDERKDGLS